MNTMTKTKLINGCKVRKSTHGKLWDVIHPVKGTIQFTGTLAEIRKATKP
jgi:hypothetical protein